MLRLAPLLILLSACSAPAFSVTLTNDGAEATFLNPSASNGGLVVLSEVRTDGAALVSFSQTSFCAPVCGAPSLGIGCAGAPFLASAFALLPGDSESVEFAGGNAWYLSSGYEGQCVRRTALNQPVRITVCRDDSVQDWNGADVDTPTSSGWVDSDQGAVVGEPACEEFDFELSESTDLQVSLGD